MTNKSEIALVPIPCQFYAIWPMDKMPLFQMVVHPKEINM